MEDKALIEVNFEYAPVVNFAMQQNHVPVVRLLTIRNKGAVDITNIEVALTAEPGFALPWTKKIDVIQAGATLNLGIVNLQISTTFLSELTERLTGAFLLTVKDNQHELYHATYPISNLSYDQWGGIGTLPEMLAAFVTPNHPEIPLIIRRAAEILEKWTGKPSFDEYQTHNPDRVKKQMAAIYEAIAERSIVYCAAPASFEDSGQRIRMADTIFRYQMANCLDLSLLYASCLEHVGIKPLLVIIKGHAFAGAWLINEQFADSVNDDASLLTKRMADGINEITVVETTCMNKGQVTSFDHAEKACMAHFANADDFLAFIDVKRARLGGIRPMPLRISTGAGWEIVEEKSIVRDQDSPEEVVQSTALTITDAIETPRQKLWERKLLDLSLRNNLINLHISKNNLQLISVSLDKLQEGLLSGDEYQIFPKPQDWDNPLRNAGIYQAINASDPITDLVKQELNQKRLRTYLLEADLAPNLINLYRTSRTALEESGANTLFISLGLLKWYETSMSEKPHYAPILLLPVEIVRKSALKGYVIRSRDEEPIINITLLEMLRQDFGLNINIPLPAKKESAGQGKGESLQYVDVRSLFVTFRQAVLLQSKWEVEEQAFLGLFSFNKFIMWNDIHTNADKLLKNKVVASLVSGKLEWDAAGDLNTERQYDKNFHPNEIILPISADSSQLEAICTAMDNKSFILHGPPGTGKSQTITNIIANALYRGKKVLFVAEKMAALEVVQTRLEQIGISRFCVELHSNKSTKTSVLEQFKNITEISKNNPETNFKVESDRLHLLRADLNNYVEALHKVYPFGMSLYDIFTAYIHYREAPDKVSFDERMIALLGKEQVTICDDIAEELQSVSGIIGNPLHHPLAGIVIKQYSQQFKNELKELLEKYLTLLTAWKKSANNLCKALRITTEIHSDEQYEALNELSGKILGVPEVSASMVRMSNVGTTTNHIHALCATGRKRDEWRAPLLDRFQAGILLYDAEGSLAEWNTAGNKWFLPKLLKQNAIVKALKSLSKAGNVEPEQVVGILENIIRYQTEQKIIDSYATELAPILGHLWQQGNCDWSKVTTACAGVTLLNRLSLNLTGSAGVTNEWRNAIAPEFSEGSATFITLNRKHTEAYFDAHQQVRDAESKLQDIMGISVWLRIKKKDDSAIEFAEKQTQKWLANIDRLRDWYNWTSIKERAVVAGLFPLVTAIEAGTLESHEVMTAYKKGLLKSFADYIFNREPELSAFNSKLFEDKIRKFRELSKKFETITRQELFARLASRIPSFTQEASQSSEISILQRAIRNGARGMSIRRLFDAISNLLPRMCPCMLMSPLSVAQYFEAGTNRFDLVIFDEASQVPTCDAVGAMARGTNVIVVGDAKQMPPTSFFTSTNLDEDSENEDLDSILEDCIALSMPSNQLLWHYRSRHESLIAFSNSMYYDNKLLTFPSTDDITTKVSFVHVIGFYDRSKTRQNKFEAQAIVDEIVLRLTNPELAKQSIGVVTFSSVQQSLINDMLDDVFNELPELEAAAMQQTEPLFIKNLENVQGDERDVILFSVGYGQDKGGKVSLNFGPLNREGGERRLNVAVSRARNEMKVFSTLKGEQIDLSRSGAAGVAGLKAFLDYAEKGKPYLQYNSSTTFSKPSAFVELIAQAIRSEGYKVHLNLGSSEYKIDIAVINPSKPSEYILGIFCDGENYKAAKTARDREIVQIDILTQLGWKIYKVWSAEWWENADRVIKDMITAIRTAAIGGLGLLHPTPEMELNVPAEKQHVFTSSTENLHITENKQNSELTLDNVHHHNDNVQIIDVILYKICELEPVNPSSSEDFLMPTNRLKIMQQILQVVDVEAPISKNLLSKRILASWGISKTGARINAQLDLLLSQLSIKKTGEGDALFYYKYGQIPNDYTGYRIAGDASSKREAEDLPPIEIANAIKSILSQQLSMATEDLIKETARLFGFNRTGTNVETAIQKGITIALSKNMAKEENGRLVVV